MLRLVVIGDSVAQGRYLSLEESFPLLLEKRLNENADSLRYEVIVLARLGYATCQEIVLLEEEAFCYEPDLVPWSYVLNDPAHPVYHDANGELGAFFYRPRSYVLHFFAKRFFALRERWNGRKCEKEFHAYLHCVYWKGIASNVERIGRVGAEHDVPIVFLIHPVFQRIDDYSQYTLRPLHGRLGGEAARNDLIPVDLLDAFDGHRPDDLRLERPGWYDPWHPNALGHAILAEFIHQCLIDRKLVSR